MWALFFQFQICLGPQEKKGTGFIAKKYQEMPKFTKYPDIWVYVPSLRRRRRVGISDRADFGSGCDINWDDMVLRVPWRYTHTIIETDVLYELAGERQAVDSPDKYPWNPYRDDGGMECYVVKKGPPRS
ncbi:MAG: outer membrane lipoprotein-sorting protein [Thermodesulfobacteriota bacterium]|nr:outer membrane lipoprotein-sorting protein [Thermodesulfobacteriota bacterium]